MSQNNLKDKFLIITSIMMLSFLFCWLFFLFEIKNKTEREIIHQNNLMIIYIDENTNEVQKDILCQKVFWESYKRIHWTYYCEDNKSLWNFFKKSLIDSKNHNSITSYYELIKWKNDAIEQEYYEKLQKDFLKREEEKMINHVLSTIDQNFSEAQMREICKRMTLDANSEYDHFRSSCFYDNWEKEMNLKELDKFNNFQIHVLRSAYEWWKYLKEKKEKENN